MTYETYFKEELRYHPDILKHPELEDVFRVVVIKALEHFELISEESRAQGYDNGFTDGKIEGYQEGLIEGEQQGFERCKDVVLSALN